MKKNLRGNNVPLWLAGLLVGVVFLGAAGYIVTASGNTQQAGIFSSFGKFFGQKGNQNAPVVGIACAEKVMKDYNSCLIRHQGDLQAINICGRSLRYALNSCQDLNQKELNCRAAGNAAWQECVNSNGGEEVSQCDGAFASTYIKCMRKNSTTQPSQ